MIKRLHRSGQKQAVLNYLLLARNTVDEVIYSDILTKEQNQGVVNDAYREATFRNYMRAKRQGGRWLVEDDDGIYVPTLRKEK
jgi:SNF2 family DNA or RNA helicase